MSEQNQNSNGNSGAKVADFILQLYLIITGLAFGYSIENLVSVGISVSSIARFLTVMIMLTIWLHGQLGYAVSETYELGHNWFIRVIEHYVEIASIILVMSAALVQSREILFYSIVLATYVFDLLLEFIYGLRVQQKSSEYQQETKVAQIWLYVDLVAVILLTIILILRLKWQTFVEPLASISILMVVLCTTLWDYSYNRDFYFGISKSNPPISDKNPGTKKLLKPSNKQDRKSKRTS